MTRLLVVAAHPDDEILGAGGLIARTVRLKGEAAIVLLTTGGTSRHSGMTVDAERDVLALRDQAVAAASTLGVSSNRVVMLDFEDQALERVPFHALVKTIKEQIVAFRPDTLVTHHWGDYNLDHQICFKACLFATRPSPGEIFPGRFATFEVLSSTERGFGTLGAFVPNQYVDISTELQSKLDAMQRYTKELRQAPHPRSVDGLRVRARSRGLEVGLEYAEAFFVVRDIVG